MNREEPKIIIKTIFFFVAMFIVTPPLMMLMFRYVKWLVDILLVNK